MSHSKLIDFQEVVLIAKAYILNSSFPEEYKSILDHVGSDYDYIFDILKHEILEEDFKATEPPRHLDRIHLDDTYRVIERYNDDFCISKFAVIKVLEIAGVDFHFGLLLGCHRKYKFF